MEENTWKFVCVLKYNQIILIDQAKTPVSTFFLAKRFYNFDFEVLEQKSTPGDTLHTQGGFRYGI